jgi:UDP-N-acetylglucosamine 1-carboxyvinyltransferase
MSSLRIEGGRPLSGRVVVEGNKNAALPLIAACLLTEQPCVLTNVPRIRDVDAMAKLVAGCGGEVEGIGTSTLRFRCGKISCQAEAELVGRLRGSVLLLGPLLARLGRATLGMPGGDFPARRSIATHVQALYALGARPINGNEYDLEAPDGLRGIPIYLEEASVTGTETAVLAAVAAKGVTEIRNAACEPHVAELCVFLRALGAAISGEGTPTIRIEGGGRLGGAEHRLDGDYIEAGSWAVVGALTGGEIEVVGANPRDIEVITSVLKRMGVACRIKDDALTVQPSTVVATRRITTGTWPGFPSDMVSLVTVLATQAEGRTLIHDWMYELRLFALEQLSGMGADLFLCDPHRIIVTGKKKLRGRVLDTRDIRSGMALIAAGLAADGESLVGPLETVERGYARVVDRLRDLGARVSLAPDPPGMRA